LQTYEIDGGDRWRKHRALKILKPTTELSGSYRCKVSSFVDEDFMQKTMIVYCKYDFQIFRNEVSIIFISKIVKMTLL